MSTKYLLPHIWATLGKPLAAKIRPYPSQIPVETEKIMGRFLSKIRCHGLASIDRNNKTTLLFTAPGIMSKSYAKFLTPRIVKLQDVS